jgi:hypothetical protein
MMKNIVSHQIRRGVAGPEQLAALQQMNCSNTRGINREGEGALRCYPKS